MIGDFTGHDMAQAREDGYDRGVQLATKYERILIDLIAALRDIYEDMGGGWDLKEATDRAEARLREVRGE